MGALAATSTAADPTTIINQFCPAGLGKSACAFESNAAARVSALQTFLTEAISTRLIPDPSSSASAQAVLEADASTNCATYAATSTTAKKAGTLITAGAGITTAGAIAAGAAAGSVVPVIGTIVGLIGGLFASLFGASHAKAVAGEQQDICSGVPAANGVLQQIDSALASGSMTAAQAQTAYSQLQTQFTTALHQGTTYKQGDALWAFNLALQCVIAARLIDLQNQAATTAGITAALGGMPPAVWVALAAAGVILFL
jgi:hypothetical protein